VSKAIDKMSNSRFDFGLTRFNKREDADLRLLFSLIRSGNYTPKPLNYISGKIEYSFKDYKRSFRKRRLV